MRFLQNNYPQDKCNQEQKVNIFDSDKNFEEFLISPPEWLL